MNLRIPCPWLPDEPDLHGPEITRRHGPSRGTLFYRDCLRYAQSHKLGKPAQALLQLDRAMMAEEPHPDFPLPYPALEWLMRQGFSASAGFLGNPVRHFQHLASRMNHYNREARIWRAWACFHLSEQILPNSLFPRDGRQIVREGLWIPAARVCMGKLHELGWPGEAEQLSSLMKLHPMNGQRHYVE